MSENYIDILEARDRRIQGIRDGLRMAMDILSNEYNQNRKEEQQ